MMATVNGELGSPPLPRHRRLHLTEQNPGSSPMGTLWPVGSMRLCAANGGSDAGVQVSIVVPVHNERENLPILHERLTRTLASCGRSYEICYVDDGSTDDSLGWLLRYALSDGHVRVVELQGNVGQHSAIIAGFSVSRGQVVVTLDADLQNPPEEIPKLLEVLDRGFDAVGGWRVAREDPRSRVAMSKLANIFARLLTGNVLRDHGCMLRAYRRHVVEAVLARTAPTMFVPLIATAVAHRPAEIPVAHSARLHGESKYSAAGLVRLVWALLVSALPFAVRRMLWCGALVTLTGGAMVGGASFVAHPPLGSRSEGVMLFGSSLMLGGVLLFTCALLISAWSRFLLGAKQSPGEIIRAVHQNGVG